MKTIANGVQTALFFVVSLVSLAHKADYARLRNRDV
jgi:hypothetical protein